MDNLNNDISAYINEWASFVDYTEENSEDKKHDLLQRLERLKALISENEPCFGENRCFL